MPLSQRDVDFDGTDHGGTETRAKSSVVGASSFPSNPFAASVNTLSTRITDNTHSTPRKTQSLKNKYTTPIAVKQVGVVAV